MSIFLSQNPKNVYLCSSLKNENMLHKVYLDDEQVVDEIPRYKRGVRIENPAISGIEPEGYITSDEFRKRATAKVNRFCDEHGLL